MGVNILTFIMLWLGLLFVLILLEFPNNYKIKIIDDSFYSFLWLIKSCIFIPLFNIFMYLIFNSFFSLIRPYKEVICKHNIFDNLLTLNIILIILFIIIYLLDLFKLNSNYIIRIIVKIIKIATVIASLMVIILFMLPFILQIYKIN